jgi:glutathione synthase/RimK-type ligase-like ATP-grasp enzyme
VTIRLALANSADYAELHPHDLPLSEALLDAGLEPVPEVWTDPSVDWSSYDAVLLRSIRDYQPRYVEFTGWLGQLDKAGVTLLNESALVRWNGDKRYLLELRERGVSIVPSQVAAGPCLREVVAALNGQEIVIKPTVGSTALHLVRGTAGDDELSQTLDDLPAGAYLVQPFQPEIEAAGEWSLTFIDGEFDHAVVRCPGADDHRVDQPFGGTAERREPPVAVLGGAAAALAALDTKLPPVYARVDGILAGGRFLLMELELIEPDLFLPTEATAVARLATAVATRLAG